MIIYCSIPQIILSGKTYRNRPINLDNIITFDKSTSTNNDKDVPSIKFTSVLNKGGKGEIFEWLFDHTQQRDNVLNEIRDKVNYN